MIILTAERILIGLAASNAVVLVACISGLPATDCTAMGQTYSAAISDFGRGALVAFVGLCTIGLLSRNPGGSPTSLFTFRFATVFFVLVAIIYFLGSAFAGEDNLNDAMKRCVLATSDNVSDHKHEPIAIRQPLGLDTWWNLVSRKNQHNPFHNAE
jgi:hypothetical protein